MICVLDGRPIEPTLLTARENGSGGIPPSLVHEVGLVFERAEFVELLSSAYAELRRALSDDIHLVEKVDDEERACLRYTALGELLDAAPTALPALIRNYLWGDLLRVCFGANKVGKCEYVVDAYRALELGPTEVVIAAGGYRIRPFERIETEKTATGLNDHGAKHANDSKRA